MVKIGEILVQKGIIQQQQLDAARAVQGEEQLGQVLINWGWITQEQLLQALDVQAPPPPPPPPPPIQPQGSFLQQQQPQGFQQPVTPQPSSGGPDLTMDNLQTSKFKIDLKTMVFVGSMLVSLVTMYFTFMGEMDARFGALENQDTELMNNIDKRLTELENKFTPIGDGVYSVDPNTTWPPSRGEYTMKQNMNANKITVLEETIDRLEKDLEKLENKIDK